MLQAIDDSDSILMDGSDPSLYGYEEEEGEDEGEEGEREGRREQHDRQDGEGDHTVNEDADTLRPFAPSSHLSGSMTDNDLPRQISGELDSNNLIRRNSLN